MYHEGVESVNETGLFEVAPETPSDGLKRGQMVCRFDRVFNRVTRRSYDDRTIRQRGRSKVSRLEES